MHSFISFLFFFFCQQFLLKNFPDASHCLFQAFFAFVENSVAGINLIRERREFFRRHREGRNSTVRDSAGTLIYLQINSTAQNDSKTF